MRATHVSVSGVGSRVETRGRFSGREQRSLHKREDALLLALLVGDECLVHVGDNTTASNGRLDQGVQL